MLAKGQSQATASSVRREGGGSRPVNWGDAELQNFALPYKYPVIARRRYDDEAISGN